jgi:hypothetical protein
VGERLPHNVSNDTKKIIISRTTRRFLKQVYSNALKFCFLNGNIGLATPSDLSCETPPPLSLSDSPTSTPLPVLYRPSSYSPPTSSVDCEVWVSITVGCWTASDSKVPINSSSVTSASLFSDPQLYNGMLHDGLSVTVSPLADHAYPDSNVCFLARRYVKLLRPLVRKLDEYGLSTLLSDIDESSGVFYRHTLSHLIHMFVRPGYEGTVCGRLQMPVTHGRDLGPNPNFWSGWLFYQLEFTYLQTVFEGESTDLLTARIYQFLSDICVNNRAVSSSLSAMEATAMPPFQTLVETTFIYKLTLGNRACGCHVCRSLPQLLTFETFVAAFCLNALDLACTTPSIPHYWFMRIHKMTQEWLGAPDNLRMFHSYCHPEGMRARVACLGRNVATMKHHTGDSNRGAESVGKRLAPLFWETWMMENASGRRGRE